MKARFLYNIIIAIGLAAEIEMAMIQHVTTWLLLKHMWSIIIYQIPVLLKDGVQFLVVNTTVCTEIFIYFRKYRNL